MKEIDYKQLEKESSKEFIEMIKDETKYDKITDFEIYNSSFYVKVRLISDGFTLRVFHYHKKLRDIFHDQIDFIDLDEFNKMIYGSGGVDLVK